MHITDAVVAGGVLRTFDEAEGPRNALGLQRGKRACLLAFSRIAESTLTASDPPALPTADESSEGNSAVCKIRSRSCGSMRYLPMRNGLRSKAAGAGKVQRVAVDVGSGEGASMRGSLRVSSASADPAPDAPPHLI